MKFVKRDKSITEQLDAVRNSGHYIKRIDNPSEAVQLVAVLENGSSIQYIENPSEAVQLRAVARDPNSIKYIFNPSEEVVKYVYTNHRDIFNEFFEEVEE